MFLRYAMTNPADLQREMPKLGEYLERERQGRAAVVKQEQMSQAEPKRQGERTRGQFAANRLQIDYKTAKIGPKRGFRSGSGIFCKR